MAQLWLINEKRRIFFTFTPDAEEDPISETPKVYIKQGDGTTPVEGEDATPVAGTDDLFWYDFAPTAAGDLNLTVRGQGAAEPKKWTVVADKAV